MFPGIHILQLPCNVPLRYARAACSTFERHARLCHLHHRVHGLQSFLRSTTLAPLFSKTELESKLKIRNAPCHLTHLQYFWYIFSKGICHVRCNEHFVKQTEKKNFLGSTVLLNKRLSVVELHRESFTAYICPMHWGLFKS